MLVLHVLRVDNADVVDLVDDTSRVDKKKARTVSVRIEENLNRRFEEVCSMLNLDKSEFLRTGIKMLCEDNKILLEHRDEVPQYINDIKERMGELPTTLAEVENGSWRTMKDIAILMLADDLWLHSKKIWNAWKKICDDYQLEFENAEGETIVDFSGEHFLELAELGMLIAGQSPIVSAEELMQQDIWTDNLELRKMTLILALKKAVEDYSAKNVIEDALQVTSREIGKPVKMFIDAEGKFTRTLSGMVGPIGYREVED